MAIRYGLYPRNKTTWQFFEGADSVTINPVIEVSGLHHGLPRQKIDVVAPTGGANVIYGVIDESITGPFEFAVKVKVHNLENATAGDMVFWKFARLTHENDSTLAPTGIASTNPLTDTSQFMVDFREVAEDYAAGPADQTITYGAVWCRTLTKDWVLGGMEFNTTWGCCEAPTVA